MKAKRRLAQNVENLHRVNFEIEDLFGYRGKRVQSYCKVCRRRNHVNDNIDAENKLEPKRVNCSGCGKNYMEKERGEPYCESCEKIYYGE